MLAVEALEILGQIQVLVIDKLQVVSYKWLSRNFSVSSNHAKRLLQEFVDKHGNNLEVLYSLSGWLKNNSGTYCIRLASGQKLEEVMKEFDGTCSVEVYSIQSCLPRDLAVLWNAEFVQAEELFNQPSTVENCLRNNRFGGISNFFVKRAVNGQSAAVSSTSQLKDNVGIVQTKASNVTKDENLQPQQENRGQFGVKEELKSSSTVGSVDKTNQNVGEYTKKTHPVKESSNPLQAKRKGIPNEKTSTGPGGSLATLWGRASVKSKPSSMASRSTSDIAIAANTADAQICAEEAADAESSDEEGYKLCYKRESNGSSTRKRQFIINYSDEEDDDDNVVSLASPIPPKEKSFSDTMQSAENLNVEKEILCTNKLERETLVNKQDIDDKSHGLSSEKSCIANASFQKAENNFQNDLASTNGKDTAPMASKRKKVVKTRIDERGREVTEVVWDEPVCSRMPTAAIKEQSTASNAPPNTGIKGGTKKPLKGGEVMKEFDGTCSVEVYSIQSCLPRDLAVLWNAEFVQAEELFNQPSTVENCLRNNRFGGISNFFVKRAVNGQSAAVSSTSQLKDNVGIVQTKASNVTKDENLQPQQENRGQFGVKEELKSSSTVGSVDKTNQNVGEYTKKTHPVKESSNPLQAKRKGIPNEKTSTGPGGSLATLWGRASVKSKPSSMASRSTSDIAIAANTADAQICAEEAADAESSDEEGYKLCYKRESNGSSTRKRQFIINYSDEEDDDDNVVSLASPIPPKEKSFSDTMQSAENLNVEKEILRTNKLERETLVNKQDIDDESHGLSSEKSSIANASFQKAENNFQNDLASTNGKDTAPASKRKKVVKTRIDERGREVTEVVWDEPVCSKDADKDKTTNDARPTAAIKEQATASNAQPNTGIKGGTKKPLKGGGKDTKQGKILSFFKKI
ncbi:hypothetical protein KFK09_027753 [Dendrobium nobile]|uniref:DNA polymerase delta subunit 3 n=1 Tax=Dendrobium nobile TaxID=94219 RepID=A0A8T3A1K0_DENNO|nr:hypothetical protein KFK09_027753 [Dendrobium nobile]